MSFLPYALINEKKGPANRDCRDFIIMPGTIPETKAMKHLKVDIKIHLLDQTTQFCFETFLRPSSFKKTALAMLDRPYRIIYKPLTGVGLLKNFRNY